MSKFYIGAFTFHGLTFYGSKQVTINPRLMEIYSDDARSDVIYYTYYEDGVKHHVKEKIRPYMFLEETDTSHVKGHTSDSHFHSYKGKQLWRVDFKSIGHYKRQQKTIETF